MFINRLVLSIVIACFAVPVLSYAQTPSETPPPPGDPPSLNIPEVKETTLDNGLKVAFIRKRGLPLVTASLLVKSGADVEDEREAGLANMTAALLTKGTEFRTATDIAEQIEFLGASIGSGAGWNSSSLTINVMKNSLGRALSIMSDSAIRPTFPKKEVQLLKKQTLDGFKVSLKQPGSLFSYVTSRYTFGEHLTGGTPSSIGKLNQNSVIKFHQKHYRPENSVLIFTGDISENTAFGFAKLFFGGWQRGTADSTDRAGGAATVDPNPQGPLVNKMLVIDLPNSGQAAVGYAKRLYEGRISCDTGGANCGQNAVFYPATVLNSVLGGGYSARLNQEIRLKRGLSYGARSGFSWRRSNTNFNAFTQTKNESAAQVAELIRTEIEKLATMNISDTEMTPRKAVVTGGFGRGLQTNNGLAGRLRDLYLYGINPSELNEYMNKVNRVSPGTIKYFAASGLTGGDIIIVGDSKMFMEDLQKRFPNKTIEVIKADELDLNSKSLRKKR